MNLRKKKGLGRRRIHRVLCEMGYDNYAGSIQYWLNGGKPTLKEFNISNELTKEKAFILGVIGPGDGYVSNNKLGLAVIDKDFAKKFQSCLEDVYGLKTSFKKEKPSGLGDKFRYRVVLYSTNVVKDLENYNVNLKESNWQVPDAIKKASRRIKAEYISAFCDSQGSVGERKIVMFSKNKKGLGEIKSLCESVDLRVKLRGNRLRILGRKSLELFYNDFGFSIQRKQKKLLILIKKYKRYYTPSDKIDPLMPLMRNYLDEGYSRLKIARMLNVSATAIKNRENLLEVSY